MHQEQNEEPSPEKDESQADAWSKNLPYVKKHCYEMIQNQLVPKLLATATSVHTQKHHVQVQECIPVLWRNPLNLYDLNTKYSLK